jgi:hypothetical protein
MDQKAGDHCRAIQQTSVASLLMINIESRGFGLIHFIDMDRLFFNVVAGNLREAESDLSTAFPHAKPHVVAVIARGNARPWPAKQSTIFTGITTAALEMRCIVS